MKVIVSPANSLSVRVNQPGQQTVHGTSTFFGAYGQEEQIQNALATANSAAAAVGSFSTQIQHALDTSNTAISYANTALTTAISYNAAITSATTQSNAAYALANTKFSSSGGTISGNVIITGNITPSVANTYTLGTQENPFQSVYVGPGSIHIDGISISNTAGQLTFNNTGSVNVVGNLVSTGTVSGTFDGGLF